LDGIFEHGIEKSWMFEIGFTIWPKENRAYMFYAIPKGLEICSGCGHRIDVDAHNPAFRMKRTPYEVTVTYDSQIIVSRRFRDFCEDTGYAGLEFLEFSNSSNYYNFRVSPILKFDEKAQKVGRESFCPVCKQYESIFAVVPSFFKRRTILKDGFYRSDLICGYGDKKRPLVIVSEQTKTALDDAGISGLSFLPAYGKAR
jgi:hypothetical protein